MSPATAKRPRRWRRKAAEAALADAGLEAPDIDLIIVATSTPDYTFPAVATQVQAQSRHRRRRRLRPAGGLLRLRLRGHDGRQVPALRLAQAGAGDRRRDLLAPARLERPHDLRPVRRRRGAIVLEARESDGRLDSPGVIASRLRSDGRHRAKLYVDGGPSTTKTVGHLRMEGKEVFRHAVGMVTDVIQGCFDDAGVTADDIDWFVPHQANRRIIDASADKLGIARDKVVVTVDRHGNTSAASIPLALDGRGQGRPDQAGRPRDDRGDGRRLHLGRGADPLVRRMRSLRAERSNPADAEHAGVLLDLRVAIARRMIGVFRRPMASGRM